MLNSTRYQLAARTALACIHIHTRRHAHATTNAQPRTELAPTAAVADAARPGQGHMTFQCACGVPHLRLDRDANRGPQAQTHGYADAQAHEQDTQADARRALQAAMCVRLMADASHAL